MKYLSIDFETRARRNPKDHSMHKYTLCPDFDVMCVSWKLKDDDTINTARGLAFSTDHNEDGIWSELKDHAADPDVIFVAHNASFEMAVWNNYLVPEWGFPKIPINRWRCTAAAAAYKAVPRGLGALCKAIGAEHQKSDEGYRHMMKMCKPIPEAYTKHREELGEWYESDEDFEILMDYCDDDIWSEEAAMGIVGLLPATLQKEWELDQEINQRGINIDMDLCHAILKMKEKVKAKLTAQCMKLIKLKPSQIEKIKDWLEAEGLQLPRKIDKKTRVEKRTLSGDHIKAFLADPSVSKKIKRVLRIRRDFATTSLAKIDAVLNMEVNGVVRDQFLFHGATTGRWAGKGIQFHNLPRGFINSDIGEIDMKILVKLIKLGDVEGLAEWYPALSLMDCLKTSIRGIVVARPGKILRVMDFSQIESRVLAWLAGQHDKIQIFLDGKDPYKHNAAKINGIPYEEVTKKQRSEEGKVSDLALGFQGGEGAFRKMAVKFGLHYTKERAEEIKSAWREENNMIVRFWYSLEAGALKAIQTGKTIAVRGIKFKLVDRWLAVKLPSGRKLWYYDPKVKLVKTSWGRKTCTTYMGSDYQNNMPWGRITTYGGRWAENITQAVARDMLAHAMLNFRRVNHNQILHVHDEVGIEYDVSGPRSKVTLEDVKFAMEEMPAWADGCPVAAAGFESTRYRKE